MFSNKIENAEFKRFKKNLQKKEVYEDIII